MKWCRNDRWYHSKSNNRCASRIITSEETYQRHYFLLVALLGVRDGGASVRPCPCRAAGEVQPYRMLGEPQVQLAHLALPCGYHAVLQLPFGYSSWPSSSLVDS